MRTNLYEEQLECGKIIRQKNDYKTRDNEDEKTSR